MNVKLLRKVKKHILDNPKRLFMSEWLKRKAQEWNGDLEYSKGDKFFTRPFPSCGTAACLAGWTCELSGVRKTDNYGLRAGRLLGLDKKERDRLFMPDLWPNQFHKGYSDNGSKNTARIAAARIEHFIKTKGRE